MEQHRPALYATFNAAIAALIASVAIEFDPESVDLAVGVMVFAPSKLLLWLLTPVVPNTPKTGKEASKAFEKCLLTTTLWGIIACPIIILGVSFLRFQDPFQLWERAAITAAVMLSLCFVYICSLGDLRDQMCE